MSQQPPSNLLEKFVIPLVVAIIGAIAIITAAFITSGHFTSGSNSITTTPTPAITPTPATNPTTVSDPTPTAYVQLKNFYSGTASGFANGSVTFTLETEDQQGNVSMQTTFQQLEGSQQAADYACHGSLTLDRRINLQCSNLTDSSYVLAIQGYVYADGHMEGTEIATNTNVSNYRHVYYWKAY